jgi:hypothetical protein
MVCPDNEIEQREIGERRDKRDKNKERNRR